MTLRPEVEEALTKLAYSLGIDGPPLSEGAPAYMVHDENHKRELFATLRQELARLTEERDKLEAAEARLARLEEAAREIKAFADSGEELARARWHEWWGAHENLYAALDAK